MSPPTNSPRSNLYRIADIVLVVVLMVGAVVSLYFAAGEGVRDYWLLVVVCLVFGLLLIKRLVGDGKRG